MQVTKRDGTTEAVDKRKILRAVERAFKGLEDVDAGLVADEAYDQLHDGITTADIERTTILSARSRIAEEPNYSYAASRLLLSSLYREVFGFRVDGRKFAKDYRWAFQARVIDLVDDGKLDPRLGVSGVFDLERLAEALRPERDHLLKYQGADTLYDRYLLRVNRVRAETPQAFWMRVAMGLAINEPDPTAAAVRFYELFSTLRYCPATPTLFNSGTTRPQLSSCFLSTMEDSIDGIFGTCGVHGQARLSKLAGGLGIDIHPLRATNSLIRGQGKSGGIVPWAKQFDTMVGGVNQEGKRKGAAAVSVEPWHIDFMDFLDLLRNTGDERRRTHDIHTVAWIPNLFMTQADKGGDWYFFCPSECPDLHELYGEAFEARYWHYAAEAEAGRLRNWKKLPARDVRKKFILATKETGHPWWVFKDTANLRHQNAHAGVIHSTNLCTEIFEPTRPTRYDEEGDVTELGETAVCTIGSANLSAHTSDDGDIDYQLLADTVVTAVRILDNAVTLNHYPTKEARNSATNFRHVGLGQMGWADVLHKKRLAFDSDAALALADEVTEFFSYHAILASAVLAGDRGAYPKFKGSSWDRGVLPVDTYNALRSARAGGREAWHGGKLDWAPVREAVARHGMRNGLTMAIAPTATISFIVGCAQSIEPDFSVLWTYKSLSGDNTMISEFFVKEMKRLKVWDREFAKRLQQVDGDVSKLVLPAPIKARFKTAFDVDQFKLIDIAAARQKWLDQGQSLNLYYAGDSMKFVWDLYRHAWAALLKSTYYLRTEGASRVEKANVERAAAPARAGAVCRVGDLMETCESCT